MNIHKDNLELYVPINQEDKLLREAHQELVSLLIGNGSWMHGGVLKMKDSSGKETEFVLLKGSLDK